MLKKLSIVVLTYERPEYAMRCMRYWSGRGPRVYVFDGSRNPLCKSMRKELSENIKYFHEPVSLSERLKKAREYLNTQYVTLLGDDEFYLPSGLVASMKELDSDASLVACMGRVLGFHICVDGTVRGSKGYSRHAGYPVLGNDAGSRMLAHMNPYTPSTIYAVVRRGVWVNAFEAYLKQEFPVCAVGELQFELSVCYHGKSKIIPVLHWLRSYENPPILDSPDISLDRRSRFHEWWSSKQKREFRSEFLQIMSETLSATNGRDQARVSKEIELALDAYVEFCTERPSESTAGRCFVGRLLLESLKSYLRRVRSSFRPARREPQRHILELAHDVVETGVSVNFDELSEIVSIVEAFHRSPSRQ